MNTLKVTCFLLFFQVFSMVFLTFSQARDVVFVSILPQKFFVQQISGNLLDIEVMVEPGANPATYEPKPSQMRKLAESKAYFAVGVPFENVWLDKLIGVNPDIYLVHTDAGIEKMAMKSHVHSGHEHGRHEHDHTPDTPEEQGLDPHIWLSPTLVKKQAATIHEALAALYPDEAAGLHANLQSFLFEIDALDVRLENVLGQLGGREFMVFHPSWGYFAREYDLQQVAIEIEGKSPKPAQLRDLITYGREKGIRVIFAQEQFSRKSAGIIARELNGEVVSIDPLAENWFANMEEIARKFQEALH